MIKAAWQQFVDCIPTHAILFTLLIFTYIVLGFIETPGDLFVNVGCYLFGAIVGAFFFAWIRGRDLDHRK